MFVEVKKRGYTILLKITDPSDPDLFWDVGLLFAFKNDIELDGRTQVAFFQTVLENIKRGFGSHLQRRCRLDDNL